MCVYVFVQRHQAEMSVTSLVQKAVGTNSVVNSFGFLIRNQADDSDPNQYIVFTSHTLPTDMVIVPFLFEDVRDTSGPVPVLIKRTVYFKVIGQDKALDLAVGVFDTTLAENRNLSLSHIQPVHILADVLEEFTNRTTFVFCCNSDQIRSKAIKTTTVENFSFNGPSNMMQFLYPKSVLLQQEAVPGTSGSPLVILQDGKLKCIGMLTQLLGSGPNYEPVAVHCSLLHTVLFDYGLIPRYVALPNDTKANVDKLASYVAQGVPKAFLGFVGQYFHQGVYAMVPELELVQNMDGFIIFQFYKSYNLSTNLFQIDTQIKKSLDNTVIRTFSPFNPQTTPPSFLYNWINSAQVRCIVLLSIEYTDAYTGDVVKIKLSNNGGRAENSLSTFQYRCKTDEPFTVEYYYFSPNTSVTFGPQSWTLFSETIEPSEVTYEDVYGETFITSTTVLPPFVVGNELVGNAWNMTMTGTPVQPNFLNPFASLFNDPFAASNNRFFQKNTMSSAEILQTYLQWSQLESSLRRRAF